ncbi:MAG: Ig-like domain-containing protein [Betaproteobacteria bacterium]
MRPAIAGQLLQTCGAWLISAMAWVAPASGNIPPTVSITTPAGSTVMNAPATFKLTATAADSDGKIMKVVFYQGAAQIGVTTSSPYGVTVNKLSPGKYTFTAEATDNQGAMTTSQGVKVWVNAPPTLSITAPADNFTTNAPAAINIATDAADSDGTIAQVEFFNGAVSIGRVTTLPFNLNWANVAKGSYSITATATDNNGATATSPPIAITVNPKIRQIYYIHTDHLNTPRVISRASDNAKVWEWKNDDPFGNNLPNEDPSNTGTKFTYNLRFAGQYYDVDTGMFYNYFRDYDPVTGRYIESDPIGLKGGISTYGYVGGNPLILIDPKGLTPFPGFNWCCPGDRGLPPINCVDRACQAHDRCYDACGINAKTRWWPMFRVPWCGFRCDVQYGRDIRKCIPPICEGGK